jgi:hypothetical protein
MGMFDTIEVKENVKFNDLVIEAGKYQTKDLGELMEVYQLDGMRLLNTQQGMSSTFMREEYGKKWHHEPQCRQTGHTCTIRMYGKRDGIEYGLTFLNGILIRVSLFLWDEEYAEYLEQTTKNDDKQKTVSDIVKHCCKLIDERLKRYMAEGALDKHQLLLVNRDKILDIVSQYEHDVVNESGIPNKEFIMNYFVLPFLEGVIRMAIS